MQVPSRTVYLPLAWEDSQTQLATERYTQIVRPDAPWCPDNVEFIRRINGLTSKQAVKDVVYSANYLVMGFRRCVFRCTRCHTTGPVNV